MFLEEIKELIATGNLTRLQAEKIAKKHQITDVMLVRETMELAVVDIAREIANNSSLSLREKFDKIVKLYNSQPNLSVRSSVTSKLQQFSTPAPITFLAGSFILQAFKNNPDYKILEPSAGNGMMTIAFNPGNVWVNEIDNTRIDNLKKTNYMMLSNVDALKIADGINIHAPYFDGVITNPPFNPYKETIDGFKLNGLEHVMAIKALKTMNDNGRAAIIVGGHTTWDKMGVVTEGKNKVFLNYLYHFYNVKDVLNINGDLYSRMGTSFDIRLILIEGRKATPKGYAPLKSEKQATQINSFDELFDRIGLKDENKDMVEYKRIVEKLGGERKLWYPKLKVSTLNKLLEKPTLTTNDIEDLKDFQFYLLTDKKDAFEKGFYQKLIVGQKEDAYVLKNKFWLTNIQDKITEFEQNNNEDMEIAIAKAQALKLKLKLKNSIDGIYVPASDTCEALDTIIPDTQDAEQRIAIRRIRAEVGGSLTEYVRTKLKYTKAEMCKYFKAEQVDAIALAVYKIDNKSAIIVGDQTGIGKGRVAAAVVRYAVIKGNNPIFVTEKPNLFSDFYRDLSDIGSGDLKPFIVNGKDKKSVVKNSDGKVVYEPPMAAEQKSIIKSKKLQAKFDYIMVTYSQCNQPKRYPDKPDFLLALSKNNAIVLDEAHNASGKSNTGGVFQSMVDKCAGVLFLSATYAKRPNNMPLYVKKTCLREANMTNDELIEAIEKGGVALQEIISAQLVQQGEMIRREKTFDGIEVNYKTLDNLVTEHAVTSDAITGIIQEIILFQKKHVGPFLDGMDLAAIMAGETIEDESFDETEDEDESEDELLDGLGEVVIQEGTRVEKRKGTKEAGIQNTDYFSKIFQVINQMLFSIKAESVANLTVNQLREGKKPIIAFSSTMESFFNTMKNKEDKPAKDGDVVSADFKEVLKKGLEGVMRYTVKTAEGDSDKYQLEPMDMPIEAQQAYYAIIDSIANVSTSICLSPIDVLLHIIRKNGFTVAEITGRSMMLKFPNDNYKTGILTARKGDEKLTANDAFRMFNDNEIDCLLINKSGSTGASAQAKPTDKVPAAQVKRRWMNVLQPELDINTEVQKRGRINRTGQLREYNGKTLMPGYTYISSAIPAEQRLMMMLKKKLSSLDANTKSNQKESGNTIVDVNDFLNEYGDKVVYEYMTENLDLNFKLGNPLKIGDKEKEDGTQKETGKNTIPEGFAQKVTGRTAILSVVDQQKFYNEITDTYSNYINYLKQMDEYNLETEAADLKAETLDKKIAIVGKGGKSAFGDDTYMLKIMANVLKKPFKKADVKQLVSEYLNGEEPFIIQKRLSDQFTEFNNSKLEKSINQATERAINETEKITQDKKFQNLKTEEERLKFIETHKLTIEEDKQKSIQRAKDLLEANRLNVVSVFKFFVPGRPCIYPTQFGNVRAIFIGYNINYKNDNPFAPGKIELRFAVANSAKYLVFNLAKEQRQKVNEIQLQTQNFQTSMNGIFNDVTVTETDHEILVETPYNYDFKTYSQIKRENNLARYDYSSGWFFKKEIKDELKSKLKEIFGEDGYETSENYDVKIYLDRINIKKPKDFQSLYLFGKELVRPQYYGFDIRKMDNVEINGSIVSNGDRKRYLAFEKGTTIIVKDVPIHVIEQEKNTAIFEVMGNEALNNKMQFSQNYGGLSDTIEKWDEYCKEFNADRKIRYIVTGNILQGYSSFKSKLVNFTTIDNLEQKGILMPDEWSPESKQGDDPRKNNVSIPIEKGVRILRNIPRGASVMTSNGMRFYFYDDEYTLKIPKGKESKTLLLDQELINLMNDTKNGFILRAGEYNGIFSPINLDEIVYLLSKKYAVSLSVSASIMESFGIESATKPIDNSDDIVYETQYQMELEEHLKRIKEVNKPTIVQKVEVSESEELEIAIAKAIAIKLKLKLKGVK